eukprot:759129-Hanusia_phi.AAC.5
MNEIDMNREDISRWELYVECVLEGWKDQSITRDDVRSAESYVESVLLKKSLPLSNGNESDAEDLHEQDEENTNPNLGTMESPHRAGQHSSTENSVETPSLSAAPCRKEMPYQKTCHDPTSNSTGQEPEQKDCSSSAVQQAGRREGRKVSTASEFSMEIASPSFMRGGEGGGGGGRGSHFFDPDSTIPAYRSLQGEPHVATMTPEARCQSLMDHREAQSVRKMLRAPRDGGEMVLDQSDDRDDPDVTVDVEGGEREMVSYERTSDENLNDDSFECCEGMSKLGVNDQEGQAASACDGVVEDKEEAERIAVHASPGSNVQTATPLNASIDYIPDSEEEREEEEKSLSRIAESSMSAAAGAEEQGLAVERKQRGSQRVQVGSSGGSRMRRLYPAGPCLEKGGLEEEEEEEEEEGNAVETSKVKAKLLPRSRARLGFPSKVRKRRREDVEGRGGAEGTGFSLHLSDFLFLGELEEVRQESETSENGAGGGRCSSTTLVRLTLAPPIPSVLPSFSPHLPSSPFLSLLLSSPLSISLLACHVSVSILVCLTIPRYRQRSRS